MKYSKQREALLENLKNRYDHPTADVIYEDLRKQFPRISLGTVYRNLGLLCETGQIKKIPCGDGVEHYDYCRGNHDHFVCRVCGKIIDLPEDTAYANDNISAMAGIGKIESRSLVFYGICKECNNKNI